MYPMSLLSINQTMSQKSAEDLARPCTAPGQEIVQGSVLDLLTMNPLTQLDMLHHDAGQDSYTELSLWPRLRFWG